MRSHLWVKECLKLDFGEEEDGKLSTSTNSQRTHEDMAAVIQACLGIFTLEVGNSHHQTKKCILSTARRGRISISQG